MISAPTGDARRVHLFAAICLLAASIPHTALLAQGLADPEAVDTIIGSDVKIAESATEKAEAVIAALDNTSRNIGEVRKRFMLDRIEIVLLPDAADESSPVGQKVEEHREEIAELRQAIEGNPMFYHAADSHSIRIGDIVALEFDDANGVTIYAAGEAADDQSPPNSGGG